MQLFFQLEDHETKVTPMKTADALINSDQFSYKELKELIAYLSVYTRYHHEDGGRHCG